MDIKNHPEKALLVCVDGPFKGSALCVTRPECKTAVFSIGLERGHYVLVNSQLKWEIQK